MSAILSIPTSGDADLQIKAEYLKVEDVVSNGSQNQVQKAREGEDRKKQKNRGRNKDRPPPMRFSRNERLCPVLIDVSPERETWPTCNFSGKCSFQHDVVKYLESKPEDLGEECFIYKNYGRCKRGLSCRFARSHVVHQSEVNQVRNLVNRELAEKFGSLTLREKNHLDNKLKTLLWKKQYEFKVAEKTVDMFFKLRDQQQAKSEAPPEKKAKFEENGADGADCDTVEETISELEIDKDDQVTDAGDRPTQLDEARPEHFLPDKTSFKKIDWTDKLYLAPLTTVGNLPFRRICKEYGVDITCGEMAMSAPLLQAHLPEWALVQRHVSEDIFGVQLCGSSPQQLTRIAQLVEDGHIDCDFIDLNLGCPIDLVYKRGMGSGLMDRRKPLEIMVRSMSAIMTRPLTLKFRTGIQMDKRLAHTLIPSLKEWGISMITLHGRSREQRYTKLADWNYISECAQIAKPLPLFGNGDVFNFEDYYNLKDGSKVDGIMLARGALIKPWLFTEIKERRHWDISATERLDIIRRYANYGMEHWGSDDKGVETTRRFLLEWLSFLHRYVPHGLLERPPQRMNERVPNYVGRSDLETLLSSGACSDWIKITEMFLGKVPENLAFVPKHKAHGY